MIMDLPSNYTLSSSNGRKEIYIENSILVIRNVAYFRKSVYDMTYELKGGKHHCSYCNNNFNKNKVTLDHMYPQDMGGPTITNNLIPVCTKCNSEKSNMTLEELRRQKKYQIPEEWISEKELSKIIVEISISDSSQYLKYNKMIKNTKDIIALEKIYIFLDNKEELFKLLFNQKNEFRLMANIEILKDDYNDQVLNY